MSKDNTMSRRGFLETVAAVGALGLTSCAANERQGAKSLAAGRIEGKLPTRREFVVRNAYVVTMDPQLGDMPRADVHVRNGTLIAVGPNLSAPGVEQLDGRNRTHTRFRRTLFHLWAALLAHRRRRDFDISGDEPSPVMTPNTRIKRPSGDCRGLFGATHPDWAPIHSALMPTRSARDPRHWDPRRFSYCYVSNADKAEQRPTSPTPRVQSEWFAIHDGFTTMYLHRGGRSKLRRSLRAEWEFARNQGWPLATRGAALAESIDVGRSKCLQGQN